LDRSFAVFARLVMLAFFRHFECTGRSRVPRDRPVLIVANHFNGFVDPLAVAAALGRAPGFVAKATLGKIWAIRPLLSLAGVVLVHRVQDGEGTSGNERAFAACRKALARGRRVAIFPEGITHDRPQLAPVKTGAARIALGASAAGVRQGAYVLGDAPGGTPEVLLMATGSEVALAVEAWEKLIAEGVKARVVSMPSWELFEHQSPEYRESVLPSAVKARVAVEQAAAFGWSQYVGLDGVVIGMKTFGASAPLKELQKKFGFTVDAVVQAAKAQAHRTKG
jgi:1-acyl-sn-glycerol-3-phosphate acyltransferase